MKGMNKPEINIQGRNSIPSRRISRRTKKYLKIMRQREVDAMVEFTRNQLMDRYDG